MADPVDPPAEKPAPPRLPTLKDLLSPLTALADETGLTGHPLLGRAANIAEAPETWRTATGQVAFAVNTGLVPAAAEPLRRSSIEDLAKLVLDVIKGKLDQTATTALLRDRFPEPRRPGAPAV